MKVLSAIRNIIIILIIVDIIVVIGTMFQIAQGIDTPHIAFYDAQIRFIINLLK